MSARIHSLEYICIMHLGRHMGLPLRWEMWTLSGGKCSAPMGNDPFYGVKKELKSKIYADYGMIMEYYSYLCRPIYIVLHWESLINIRLN